MRKPFMKERVFLSIFIGICIVGGGFFIRESLHEYTVKEKSVFVKVKVMNTPYICLRRNNKIPVKLKEKTYWLPIRREECKNNKYQIGDIVNVLWDDKNEQILSVNYNPIGGFIIGIAIFLVPLFIWYKTKQGRQV